MTTAAVLRPHRLPAPGTEPPYDERLVPAPAPHAEVTQTQGTLALALGPPADPTPKPTLRLVPKGGEDASGVRRPAARAWAVTVAHGLAEILAGTRPAVQFQQWSTPDVFALVARKARVVARAGASARRAATGTIHVCCPTGDAIEVSTVLLATPRPRALAFRLESRGERWVCTALELG